MELLISTSKFMEAELYSHLNSNMELLILKMQRSKECLQHNLNSNMELLICIGWGDPKVTSD